MGRRKKYNWDCKDCGRDTLILGEFPYCLRSDVWNATGLTANGDDGKLCIRCCERRLGRKLNKTDFVKIEGFRFSQKRLIDYCGNLIINQPYRKSSKIINRVRRPDPKGK